MTGAGAPMSAEVLIALLRGVNVGGAGRLPMAEWRGMLAAIGCTGVQTYIQSGNAVFRAERTGLAEAIGSGIVGRFGFRPHVFLLTLPEIEAVLAANPFAPPQGLEKTVHIFFLDHPAPDADLAGIQTLAAPDEAFHLTDAAFYLHAPSGIGRSVLAQKLGRFLAVPTTARNLASVQAVVTLARGLEGG